MVEHLDALVSSGETKAQLHTPCLVAPVNDQPKGAENFSRQFGGVA